MQISENQIYKRYSIRGYNGTTPDGMTCFEPCIIHVMAENENDALYKAKLLVDKKNYMVVEAGEYIYDKQLDGR